MNKPECLLAMIGYFFSDFVPVRGLRVAIVAQKSYKKGTGSA